jgi:hypothetical protein
MPAPAAEPAVALTAADTLSDVLETVRLTGALFFLVDASTPWVAEAPASPVLGPVLLPRVQHVVSYHVIRTGVCWCESPGEPPMRLEAGDVLVVPHGQEYALTSEPGLRSGLSDTDTLGWFRDMSSGRLPFIVEEGGGGPERIGVVCGFLGCDALPFNPVLATLPPLVRVRLPAAVAGDRLSRLVDYALAESRDRSAGSQSVLLRIAELVFVEVVRAHLMALPAASSGWLGGLRDPVVGGVLARLHAQPAEHWTLEQMARDAAVSRTVLADALPGGLAHAAGGGPARGSGPHRGGDRPGGGLRVGSRLQPGVQALQRRRPGVVAAHRASRAAGAAAARSPRRLTPRPVSDHEQGRARTASTAWGPAIRSDT